ncbi:hypothetical protein GLOIN_2v328467 [Rhizophagus clarus]|uniref:Uncharacterized protein n=1 Tax=Rhizophagus clarus TaxID=94130 RepID=A0A8H3QQZ3_9GLOM|nr:hypothetical protein GLOIN_2v328467 [Rhizophagus clarus]
MTDSTPISALVDHHEYWNRDPSSWGSLNDWDIYFIENVNGRGYSKATALKKSLENCNNDSGNKSLWENHLSRLGTLATMDRVNKREIRSIAMQEETERYKSEQASKLSSNVSHKADNYEQKKINEFFSRDITSLQLHENDNTDHENEKPAPSSPSQDAQENYMEDHEYFDKLINNVDLSYIGGEEEPAQPPPKSGVSVEKAWGTFMIDEIDIAKCFSSLRKSIPKTSPEVHPQYWGVLDLTGQHKQRGKCCPRNGIIWLMISNTM